MKAILAIEDGTVFEGESFGAEGEQYGCRGQDCFPSGR